MKNIHFMLHCILSVLVLACFTPADSSAQQTTPSPEQSGTYVYLGLNRRTGFPDWTTNTAPLFTLRLETNGTYLAESAIPRHSQGIDGGGSFSYPDAAKGTWRWDAQKREFLLEPGTFTFYIKRLPVDPHNPNRLVWGSGFLERQETR